MANEFRKVTDQNGVDHPVTDDTRMTWTANGVLGAENILLNQVSAGTVSNVVVSSVDNDKIKLVGTSNGADNAIYSRQKVGAGSYRLSAVYTGTSSDNQRPSVIADLYNANGTVKTSNYVIVRPSITSANVTVTGTDYLSNFRVYFAQGDVLDMEIAIDLKLSSDTNTEHVKGAMTNRELTEKVDIAKANKNTSTFSVTLDAGDVYLVFAGGGGVSDKLTSTQYGYVGIVCREPYNNNMLYGNIHKGSDVTPSVSDYTFTLTATTAIAMGAIKLNKAVEV